MFLPKPHVINTADLAQIRRVMAKAAATAMKNDFRTPGRVGRPPKASLLSELRIDHQLTQEDVGRLLGMEGDAYGKIERGETRLKADQAVILADFYGVGVAALIGRSWKIKIRGFVGAGAEVHAIENPELREVDCPIGMEPEHTVALEVRGYSLLPLVGDGWIVFYSSDDRAPSQAIGQTCVVKLAGGGPTLLKNLRRGYAPNSFILILGNTEPIEDAEIEWAAPIFIYQSPEMVRARPVAA